MADPLFAAARALFAVARAPGRVPLEVARRRRAPAIGSEERTLHHTRSRHSTLPDEFSIQIDIGPDCRAYLEVGRVDHSKRDIALASRRPGRRGDAADLTLAIGGRVQQRVVRRLVARDVQADEKAAQAPRPLREERAPPVEMALLEVDQPCEPELQGRAIAPRSDGLLGGHEIDVWAQEPRLDARDVERLRADGPDAARAAGLHERVPY